MCASSPRRPRVHVAWGRGGGEDWNRTAAMAGQRWEVVVVLEVAREHGETSAEFFGYA